MADAPAADPPVQATDDLAVLVDISIAYRGAPVLKDLSWRLPNQPGMVAVRGPSGSGKTTVLHLLSGLLAPSRGTIDVLGVELSRLSDGERRSFRRDRVGHVFQDFRLLPELTALENVEVPLWLRGVSRRAAAAQASDSLAEVGLDWARGRLPGQLSGGEQQRVAIARAQVSEPQLILADEPTANLDDASAALIGEMLMHIAQSNRRVVVATHDARMYPMAASVFELVVDTETRRARIDGLRGNVPPAVAEARV